VLLCYSPRDTLFLAFVRSNTFTHPSHIRAHMYACTWTRAYVHLCMYAHSTPTLSCRVGVCVYRELVEILHVTQSTYVTGQLISWLQAHFSNGTFGAAPLPQCILGSS
jgi:hypothetical protein